MTRTKHLLSVDLEDWFHILDNKETRSPEQWDQFPSRIENNTKRLLDLFDKHNVKATFFVLSWIAEKFPNLIKLIHSKGHEIGSHSYSHPLIYDLTKNAFEKDLVKSISILENIIDQKIKIFRAPGFSITNSCTWAFGLLAKHGIEYDSSVFPATRAHGGLTDYPKTPFKINTQHGTIKEFPISTFSFINKPIAFSGGGYFRFFSKKFIERNFTSYENKNESVITYFHPRDFDPTQPQLNLSYFRKFKTYVNLNTSLSKLDYFLGKFCFTTITDLSEYQVFDIEMNL